MFKKDVKERWRKLKVCTLGAWGLGLGCVGDGSTSVAMPGSHGKPRQRLSAVAYLRIPQPPSF